MLSVSEVIKRARTEKGLTLRDLSKITGLQTSMLQRYETGQVERLNHKAILLIATALSIEPRTMMGFSENTLDCYRLPLLGRVSAGNGLVAHENIEGHRFIPAEKCKNNPDCFILRVSGDSMSPTYDDGELVLVRPQSSVDSGSYAVVIVDNESALIKKVVYQKRWISLISDNENYLPRTFEDQDVLRVHMVGLVLGTLKDIEGDV